MPTEDAQWRVNTPSFIGHSMIPEGGTCIYNPPVGGEVAENLSPMNAAAQAVLDAQKSDHPNKAKKKAAKPGKAGAEPEGGAPVAEDKAGEDVA